MLALAAASPSAVRAESSGAVATVIPPEGLNLRPTPDTTGVPLDLAPGGTRVALIGPQTESGWYPAVYKGKHGWMSGEFLEVGADATAITRRASVRGVEGAGLYAEPHGLAPRLLTIATGSAITVSARSTTDGWVLVAHAGLTGWVAVEQIAIEGATPPSPPVTASPSPPLTPLVGLAPAGTTATPLSLPSPVVPGTATRVTITYYAPSLEGGVMACGGRYHGEDPTIASAVSWPCGTRLRVCYRTACIVVTVQDTGEMGPNWVDLSSSAFRQLAPLPEMMLTGTVDVLGP